MFIHVCVCVYTAVVGPVGKEQVRGGNNKDGKDLGNSNE